MSTHILDGGTWWCMLDHPNALTQRIFSYLERKLHLQPILDHLPSASWRPWAESTSLGSMYWQLTRCLVVSIVITVVAAVEAGVRHIERRSL